MITHSKFLFPTSKPSDQTSATERMNETMKNENAVSDLIAIVLLLGVLVVGVGIIMVTMTSQPLPDEIPNINILVGNTTTTVLIKHNGGDPLQESEFTIVADGTVLRNQDATITGGDGAWPWTVGETLRYPVAAVPHQVSVLYAVGGGSVLLKSATLDGEIQTGGPDAPGPGEGIDIHFDDQDELDAWGVDQFVQQLEGNSIYLYQNIQSQSDVWGNSGFFNFTIAKAESYLELTVNNIGETPDRASFNVGDRVSIRLQDSTMRFFAIGNGGWHTFATDVAIFKNNVRMKDSTGKIYNNIVGGRLYGFDEFDSSVDITTKSRSSNPIHTEFYINNTPLINSIWTKPITLTNVQPAQPTLLILDISKNDPNYIVGNANSITGIT